MNKGLFLLSAFSFENGVFVGHRFDIGVSGDYLIKRSIFSDIDTTYRGGCLFLDVSNSNIKFYDTVFLRCSSSYSGNSAGAISIFKTNSVEFVHLCFNRCSNINDVTNFQICAYAYSVKRSSYNSSAEVDSNKGKYVSTYASHIGGTDSVIVNGVNNTRNVLTGKHEFGIVFAASINTFVRYCLFESGQASYVIRTFNTIYYNQVHNCIFRNNTASCLHIFAQVSGQTIRYHQCIFTENSISNLATGTGSITISNCIFDNDFSGQSFVSESNNLFLTTTNTILGLPNDLCFESVSSNIAICNTIPKIHFVRISALILTMLMLQ